MYKVLVVDNEAIERKALILLINKHFSHELSELKEAKNGQDAIDIAKVFKPDIILMDIQMPVLDGLDASKFIKEFLPKTQIIILTAFDYFEYAKKAIQIQVVDYLLKPVSEEKLVSNMNKIIDSIKEEIKVERENLYNSNQLNKLKPILKTKILKEIIYKDLTKNQYKQYETLFELSGYQYVCVVIDNGEDGFNENFVQGLGHKLRFIFHKVFIETYGHLIVGLLYFDEQSHGNFENVIENILREVNASAERYAINIGVSKVYSHPEDISEVYTEANEDLRSKKYIETKIHENQLESYPIDVEVRIYDALIYKDFDKAMTEVAVIMDYLLKVNDHQFSKIVIKQLCFMLHRNLIYKFGTDVFKDSIREVLIQIDGCRSLNDINDYLNVYLEKISSEINEVHESKGESIINDAKDYLDNNFKTKSCSLNQVADALLISPSYLSRLFKKVEKSNFKDYIIYLRMEEAKTLLRETNLTTKEISQQIGYDDPNYFSRAFKKYEGIPATIYARKVR